MPVTRLGRPGLASPAWSAEPVLLSAAFSSPPGQDAPDLARSRSQQLVLCTVAQSPSEGGRTLPCCGPNSAVHLFIRPHSSHNCQSLHRCRHGPAITPWRLRWLDITRMLRTALTRARAALWAVSQASASSPAGVQLQQRALTSLLGFRELSSQSWAAQSAAAPPVSPQQDVAAPAAPAPWTPTRELRKRKVLTKRMQHLLTASDAMHAVRASRLWRPCRRSSCMFVH